MSERPALSPDKERAGQIKKRSQMVLLSHDVRRSVCHYAARHTSERNDQCVSITISHTVTMPFDKCCYNKKKTLLIDTMLQRSKSSGVTLKKIAFQIDMRGST